MRGSHPSPLSLLLPLAMACGRDKVVDSGSCTLLADPAAAVVGGDANGDGHADVSDAIYLQRYLFAGGPAPVCAAAVDLVPDGSIDASEAFSLLNALGPRAHTYIPTVDATTCPSVARAEEPACGDGLRLDIDAPADVTGSSETSFDVSITLTSPSLAVEAWSFTLRAEGCDIVSGGTAGTMAADKAEDPPGLREGGFAWQAIPDSNTARVITALDWRGPTALPASSEAATLHSFTLTGTPTSDCATCTLSLVSETSGVEAVISAGGYRYTPALGGASVRMCSG